MKAALRYAFLRNVIERVAVDGGDGGGRTQYQQHLLLRRADRDLLKRAWLQHVAALEGLGRNCRSRASASAPASASAAKVRRAPRRSYRKFGPKPGILIFDLASAPGVDVRGGETASNPRSKPMIFPRFRRAARPDTISTLYGMIVAQARMPCFYHDYAVPDTVNGRFDVIVLHLGAGARPARRRAGAARSGAGAFRPLLAGHGP